jgi:hypothetical protein
MNRSAFTWKRLYRTLSFARLASGNRNLQQMPKESTSQDSKFHIFLWTNSINIVFIIITKSLLPTGPPRYFYPRWVNRKPQDNIKTRLFNHVQPRWHIQEKLKIYVYMLGKLQNSERYKDHEYAEIQMFKYQHRNSVIIYVSVTTLFKTPAHLSTSAKKLKIGKATMLKTYKPPYILRLTFSTFNLPSPLLHQT